jgi:hypothetical protein
MAKITIKIADYPSLQSLVDLTTELRGSVAHPKGRRAAGGPGPSSYRGGRAELRSVSPDR